MQRSHAMDALTGLVHIQRSPDLVCDPFPISQTKSRFTFTEVPDQHEQLALGITVALLRIAFDGNPTCRNVRKVACISVVSFLPMPG